MWAHISPGGPALLESAPLHDEHVRLLIRAKLADGRLPHDLRGARGSPANGETCLACEQEIRTSEVVMESTDEQLRTIRLHVECFWIWESECTVRRRWR